MTLEQLLDGIVEMVNKSLDGHTTWREKYEYILEQATEDQKVALREFASWFED